MGNEVDSFEQACALPPEELDALLASSRPEQRVWAIWAHALRTNAGFAPRAGDDADPGVRRTLAVMLASTGQLEVLNALARHDPVVVVRESAIQLVVRIVATADRAQPAIDATRVRALLATIVDAARAEPEVQIALLGAIGHAPPAPLVDIAHRLLESPNADVQAEAFEALLRIGDARAHDAARTWMLRQPAPWTLVSRWLRAADMESLADAFAGTAMPVRGHVLGKLRSPPFPVVETLIEDDLELLRAMLRRTDVTIPARVLAATIMRGAHAGFVERLADQLAVTGQGRQLLADLRRAIESFGGAGGKGAPLAELFARARVFADALEILDRDEMLREVAAQHPVEQLLGLDNAVAQWLARADAPVDLMPIVPALRRYCAQHVETIGGGSGNGRRRPQLPAPGQANEPVAMTNERRHFERLIAALDRILAPSRS